jgi:hypothetical protein
VLEVETRTTISLLGDCDEGLFCRPLVEKIQGTVDKPKYRDGAAIMPVPKSLTGWMAEHRTARKRFSRAQRLGYEFREIDRANYSDDIFKINTSLAERQGRPMSAGYLEHRQQGSLPRYPCKRHNIRTYGVVSSDEHLVAYMTLYRINELALISMILGHGDHLKNDIMYLLFAGTVLTQANLGGWFYYNLWDSGQDGLRYYKEKVGFREGDVKWVT